MQKKNVRTLGFLPLMKMLPLNADLPQSGSLTARWNFGESSSTRFDSVGSNDLTDNNTVLSGTGYNGDTCADFEKDNSESLSIADNADVSVAGDYSYSTWVKLESAPSTNQAYTIVSKWDSGGAGEEEFIFSYRDSGGQKQFRQVYADSSGNLTIGTLNFTLTAGIWYHITYKVDVSTKVGTVYINGASIGTFSNSTTDATSMRDGTGDFAIGARAAGSGYLDGLMQDSILWSGVLLSDAEAEDLYNVYFNLPDEGDIPQSVNLVTRWRMTEDGGIRYDQIGGLSLTDNNTVLSGDGISEDNADAQFAADIEAGNSEYFSRANGTVFDDGSASIALWVKFESLPSALGYIAELMSTRIGSSGDQGFGFGGDSVTNKFRLIFGNGNDDMDVNGTTLIVVGTWYHVVAVWDGTDGRIFLNGIKEDTDSTGATLAAGKTTVYVGNSAHNTARYMDGLMQDVMYWSVKLSDAEVLALYELYTVAAGGGLVSIERTPIRGVMRGAMRP